MVSRRRFLQLGAASLVASGTAGCLSRSGPLNGSDDDPDSASTTVANGPSRTPGDVADWTPDWSLSFDGANVLGLDAVGGDLFTTTSQEDGPSSVTAIDTPNQSIHWQTEMDGEAVGGSHAGYQRIARGGWGVTPAADAIYAVAGRAEEREWTELHALDRATGERRWSFKRGRELAVAGVSNDLLVASGLEFFPPADVTPVSHQTPEEPLTTVVYGIDAADGAVRWTREFSDVKDVAVGQYGVFVAAGDRLVGLGRDGEKQFTVGGNAARWVEVAGDRVFFLAGEGSGATLRGVAPNGDVDWRLTAPVEELLLGEERLYAGGSAVLAVEPDGRVVWRDDDYGQWLLLAPDGDTLYTRSGVNADAATAYDVNGEEQWTFTPPSNNAWPEAATTDHLIATAITADSANDSFYTVYSVDSSGEATTSFSVDTVFDALGLNGTVYLADGESNLLALIP